MERFLRSKLLIGDDKFAKLQSSTVTVVGLGAVGSYAVEALARSGVGNLRLIDFDKVDITNINRQLYALESTIGLSKAELAKKRVLDINPNINVEIIESFVNTDTIDTVLDNSPDIVVDAIDTLNPKVQLLTEVYKRSIPVISSMGAGLKTDLTKIKYGDIFKTEGCSLARFVRKRLRRQGISSGIKCVYSTQNNIDALIKAEDNGEGARVRNTLGSFPTVTGIFGLSVAHYTIEHLCEGFTDL